MKPTADEHLRGYRAAAKAIEEFTDSAQKDRPKLRKPWNMAGTASYREGYFAGLAAAHAMLALGEHPLVPSNAHVIMNLMRDADAEECRNKPIDRSQPAPPVY